MSIFKKKEKVKEIRIDNYDADEWRQRAEQFIDNLIMTNGNGYYWTIQDDLLIGIAFTGSNNMVMNKIFLKRALTDDSEIPGEIALWSNVNTGNLLRASDVGIQSTDDEDTKLTKIDKYLVENQDEYTVDSFTLGSANGIPKFAIFMSTLMVTLNQLMIDLGVREPKHE